MKKWLRWISVILLVTILGAVIAFEVSPKPGTKLIQFAFNREVPIGDSGKFEQAKETVNVIKNERYDSPYARNTFDVYYPKNLKKTEQVPVVFWLHGGGYLAGDKSLVNEFAHYVAEKEQIAMISANYELAPELKYPGQVKQLEDVYQYVRKHVADYPYLDLTKVAFGGDSAGAQIAGQFVLIQTNPDYAKQMDMTATVPKNEMKAFISYSGPVDLQQLKTLPATNLFMKFFARTVAWDLLGDKEWKSHPAIDEASIAQHVTTDFPPTYITDGNTLSFPEQGKALDLALKSKNVSVESLFFDEHQEDIYHEYQFSYDLAEAQQALDETLIFLRDYMK